MCMLPLTAILVASEAMAASKRPLRSHLTSKLNSVTSITYVTMPPWPLNTPLGLIFPEAKHDPLTCVASPQVKTECISKPFLLQVVQLEAKDDDCGEYGDICSYEIETESQPFDIDGKGQ